MEYAIVITSRGTGYMAQVPDLETEDRGVGRVVADTPEGALDLIREEIKTSIKASIESVIEDAMEGEEYVPEPSMSLSDAMTGDFVEYAPQEMEVIIAMAGLEVGVDIKVTVEVDLDVKAEVKVKPKPAWE